MEPDFVITVEGVYVGDQKHASSPREEIVFSLEGIRKDRHFGFSKLAGVREKRFHSKGTEIWNSRQWSAVSVEEMIAVSQEMGIGQAMNAEWVGANLLFSGYPSLTQLPPMTRLVFPSGAVLLVYAENLPCIWPGEVMLEQEPSMNQEASKLFPKAALHRRGLVGWVERAGTARTGDTVKVYLPRPPSE